MNAARCKFQVTKQMRKGMFRVSSGLTPRAHPEVRQE